MSFADLEFDEVAVERSTIDGLKPDVLLLNKDVPILGIEILVTHAVDEYKAARYTYPWIEVKAVQVLQSPRSWTPVQMRHPWANHCRACLWIKKIMTMDFHENNDPTDYVAQLSASILERFLLEWLPSASKRTKAAVHWRCSWCGTPNQRHIRRDQMTGVSVSSSLLPPCEPEVTINTANNGTFSIIFGFPKNRNRPWMIVPMPERVQAILRATPSPKHPHRIILNGTNRPLAFICKKCGRDCLGTIPSPLFPVQEWELLSLEHGIK